MQTPTSPQYVALSRELQKLFEAAGGVNALVFDEAGLIWCTAIAVYSEERPIVYGQIAQVLEEADPPLQRGGKIDRTAHGAAHHLYCKSFAQIYVVGVWFEGQPAELRAHRAVRDALPRIEELTLGLPPPEGPDENAGVAAKPIA